MARFGRDFVRAATQPAYLQGLFTAAQQVGSAPRRRRFNEIMQRGQAALASAAPDPTVLSGIAQELSSLGYTEEASKFSEAAKQRGLQAAQRARASGLLTQAGTREGITSDFSRDYLASGGTLEDLTTASKLAKQFAEPRLNRGRGELEAMAIQKGFDEENLNMLNAYLGMADSFGVDRTEAMKILKEAKGLGTKRVFKTSPKIIRDSVGNKFEETTITYADGTSEVKTIPISGNQKGKTSAGTVYTGKTPVGDTVIISRESGVSGEDRPRLAGEIQEARDFSTLQVEAAENILELKAQRDNLIEAVNLLDSFETEGIPEQIANFIQRESGIQDPNKAEYELIVGEAMYSRLKPLFGGVISEGERSAVEGLYANLKRGNPANRRILTRLKTIVENSIVKQNLIRTSQSFEDYNRKLNKFFEKTGDDVYIIPSENNEKSEGGDDIAAYWNPETQQLEFNR